MSQVNPSIFGGTPVRRFSGSLNSRMAEDDSSPDTPTTARMSGIDLGELSRPATVLVEKISDAVGGIFRPWQIVRLAKAEIEAERLKAEGQIAITDVQRRAFHRFLQEEVQKQENIEAITHRAIPQLEAGADPSTIAYDWIADFFANAASSPMQKCRCCGRRS